MYVLDGRDAILPCGPVPSAPRPRVTTVEWQRVDGPSPLTLYVLRDGAELPMDQAPAYAGRTAVLKDGSLKLEGVQRNDTGDYK